MAPRFANILLSGPCNLRCPYCVGGQVSRRRSNLDVFPLRGLDRFLAALRRTGTLQVSLTGTDTEPLLYRHPRALVHALREAVPGVQLSLHTNGVLVTRRLDVVHLFDRVAVSVPSFRPDTFFAMTGSRRVVDLAAILRDVRVPVKVSTTVTRDNVDEVEELLAGCAALGVRRVALRRVYDAATGSSDDSLRILDDRAPVRTFAGNPVFDIDGVEVTLWDFGRSELMCLNLFADGTISGDYLLSLAPAGAAA
jgi:cyclic pyranopterin phosphate synthase